MSDDKQDYSKPPYGGFNRELVHRELAQKAIQDTKTIDLNIVRVLLDDVIDILDNRKKVHGRVRFNDTYEIELESIRKVLKKVKDVQKEIFGHE